ncbi:MAG: hypothetical protein SXV54_00460 [Chloroflexota bacterium]|nr:hypothetical protein [Chloroflexota bacterium]
MKRRCRRLKGCLAVLALLLACGCTSTSGNDQGLPFQDGFEGSDSGWGTDQSEEFRRGYERDEYFIELFEANWFTWAYPGMEFYDVSVEIEAYPVSDSQDGHFGVLCRHVDVDNFYYFAISADGYYAIFRRVDGRDLETLIGDGDGMLPSSAIKTGGQTNHIVAVCQGDDLSLYVNGELLETVTDDTHAQGDVGFGAGSDLEGEVRVQFDNFLVTRP